MFDYLQGACFALYCLGVVLIKDGIQDCSKMHGWLKVTSLGVWTMRYSNPDACSYVEVAKAGEGPHEGGKRRHRACRKVIPGSTAKGCYFKQPAKQPSEKLQLIMPKQSFSVCPPSPLIARSLVINVVGHCHDLFLIQNAIPGWHAAATIGHLHSSTKCVHLSKDLPHIEHAPSYLSSVDA
jgi:hypothetical protein